MVLPALAQKAPPDLPEQQDPKEPLALLVPQVLVLQEQQALLVLQDPQVPLEPQVMQVQQVIQEQPDPQVPLVKLEQLVIQVPLVQMAQLDPQVQPVQMEQQDHKVIVLDYNTNFLPAPVAEIRAQAY